jgi:thiamine biosynthesis lipoprotein ApbE
MIPDFNHKETGKYLEDNNIHSYIINAGGNVKVGKAYKKEYYKIGIADPLNPSDIFIKLNIIKSR